MSIEIYTISGSPVGWRVLLALAFKQLDYKVNYLNLSKKENKTEAYLRINPRGTVPTMVSGHVNIGDSMAILAWLDRAHPSRPLFGATQEEAARIWHITMEACEYLRGASKDLLLPVFFHGIEEKTDELSEAANTMLAEFKKLEMLLTHKNFIGGSQPCAADAVCFPEVRLIQRAMETKTALMTDLGFTAGLSDFPNLAGWLERVEAYEGVKQTMPPHWS